MDYSAWFRVWFGMERRVPKILEIHQDKIPTSPSRKRVESTGSQVVQSHSSGSDDGFVQSMIFGTAQEDRLMGGLIGGNLAGGLIGGAKAHHNEPQASEPTVEMQEK